MVAQKSQSSQSRTVRIIGGDWRGRKLPVVDAKGLRPTADRIRETLFNWLANDLPGARCLDLFAGSGSLSFEALSRGAAHVTAVDSHKMAIESLTKTAAILNTDHCFAVHSSAAQWLQTYPMQQPSAQFDIVFLDPPFQDQLLANTAMALEASGCLTADALIYVEQAAGHPLAKLPSRWRNLRHKVAGKVSYQLFCVYSG
ncbi:MAG: 16S rRNA (guanine(966)-N(2))-methyltransferase RsmD [Pseudomonadota bacterium]|nr:16S rRNA (guanine(966)-N(2))-methyltransferase RsmD [Pseudomonadota bacterium]